jgi:hypothetical protein
MVAASNVVLRQETESLASSMLYGHMDTEMSEKKGAAKYEIRKYRKSRKQRGRDVEKAHFRAVFESGYDYVSNRRRKVVKTVWIVARMSKNLWQSWILFSRIFVEFLPFASLFLLFPASKLLR